MFKNISGLNSSSKVSFGKDLEAKTTQSFTGKKSVDKQHEKDIYLKAKESPKEKNDFWKKALIATGILGGGAAVLYCKKDSIKKFLKMGGAKTEEEETAAKVAKEALQEKHNKTKVAEEALQEKRNKTKLAEEALREKRNKTELAYTKAITRLEEAWVKFEEASPANKKEAEKAYEQAKKKFNKAGSAFMKADNKLIIETSKNKTHTSQGD